MFAQGYAQFEKQLTSGERRVLRTLRTPTDIQTFLDDTPYSTEPRYRCPWTVLRERRAHCFDGASFAAMALARLGHPPTLVDMVPWDDDDHVIAVFRRGTAWGAIAKSNVCGLRYREPVYRDLRELVMSYFEPYFNLARVRTLRGYTRPLRVSRFVRRGWLTSDACLDLIAEALDAQPRVMLFSRAQVRAFTRVDERTVRANLRDADPAGLYQPKKS